MKSSIRIVRHLILVIGLTLLILYNLCDMSMAINDHIKIRKYKKSVGKITNIRYDYGEYDYTYIMLDDSFPEYVINDRNVIAKTDTGKVAEITYCRFGGVKGGPLSDLIVIKISIDKVNIWARTPSYAIDVIFILFSSVIVCYAISEIYKEVKQNNTLRSAE